MSWHYSRALVAEYSAESCSGGEPSAQLNGTPTPAAYYWPDKTTGHSLREVKEHEFWAEIGKQNVHPRIEGKFPFTSVFVTPFGLERGRIIESLPRVNGAPQKRHMVPNCNITGAEPVGGASGGRRS